MNMPLIVPTGSNMHAFQALAKELGGILQHDKRGHSVINDKLLTGYTPVRSSHKFNHDPEPEAA